MIRSSSTWPITATQDYTEARPITPTIPAEAASQPPPLKRLVVLVPDAEVDEARLATKLWSMASGPGLNLLLLGLSRDSSREARLQRRLATIASIARDRRTQVDSRVSVSTRWESLIQSVWQAGDLLVCHAEQSSSVFGIGREPLAPVLASRLKVPVFAVAGFYPDLPPDLPEWASRIIAIVPLILFFAGFIVALIGIQRFTTGPAQTVLLCLAVIIEYVLIAAWETFLTRRGLG